MSSERYDQIVHIHLFDKDSTKLGILTLQAKNWRSFQGVKTKKYPTERMEYSNIPMVEKPDNETPIQYYDVADVKHSARLMLLEETKYTVKFELDEDIEMDPNNPNNPVIFPSLEKENHKNLTYDSYGLFDDNSRMFGGFLNFHSYVGKSFFDVIVNGRKSHAHPFEVRSKKIGYMKQYPAMISDLSEAASGLIFEPEAPLYQHVDFIEVTERTFYQDFMFLEFAFSPDKLPNAYEYVKHNLNKTLERYEEEIPITFASNVTPSTIIDMVSCSDNLYPANSTAISPPFLGKFIPITVNQQTPIESIDTPENRLVKDLLISLDSLISKLTQSIEKEEKLKRKYGYVRDRLREFEKIINQYLSDSWIKDIGHLRFVPLNSQVLQKKEGYRDLFKLYLTFEFALRFSWEEMEDHLYGFNKKLSELYEYWCYFKLISVLGRLSNEPITWENIFQKNNDWTISVKRGQKSQMHFPVIIHGQDIDLYLTYNRLFSRHTRESSYSLPFKPDYSIRVHYHERDVYIHFDAKYRSEGDVLDFYEKIGQRISDLPEEKQTEKYIRDRERELADRLDREETKKRTFKAGDIYKMHTYKDAIIMTEGAYIFYPGDKQALFKVDENTEIPSVGAFPLTPGKEGEEEEELEGFIRGVLRKVLGNDDTKNSDHSKM